MVLLRSVQDGIPTSKESRIVGSHLPRALAPDATNGLRFRYGRGDALGSCWRGKRSKGPVNISNGHTMFPLPQPYLRWVSAR